MWAVIVGMIRTETYNYSPKVVVPGFFGMTAAAVFCNLHNYHIEVDWPTVFTGTVAVMILLGVVSPQNNKAAQNAQNIVTNGKDPTH